uniref:Putative secreted peptide n=1 Tax=Rhipicephalus pulchellus TaxID=72859 RepID=L7MA40_RHIPC
MRAAIVGLILIASALIPADAGIASALAKALGKLPRVLKVMTVVRPSKSVIRVLTGSRAQMSTMLGLQAIHTALDFVPPPGGFQSGPEGYKGPGISGQPKKLTGGLAWTECTSCKCRFTFNASLYGDTMGCTAWATLKCTCDSNACTEDRMAECANEVAAKA